MGMRQMTAQLVNSLPMWIFCIATIGLVIFQAVMLVWLGKQYSGSAGISKTDINQSVKAGFISTLGPVFSIFVVGLGLIAHIGAPITLARLSVVGNVMYETSAAELGAAAMDTSISAATFDPVAFTCSIWVMNLGGICMLLPAIFFTKPLTKFTQKVSNGSQLSIIIAVSVSIASIACFAAEYSMVDRANLTATAVSFFTMIILYRVSKKIGINWLREWALTLSILAAVGCAMFVS